MEPHYPLFERFMPAILSFPDKDAGEAHLAALELEREDRLRVLYAPFDWVNLSARVVICGITPGQSSMKTAVRAAKDALRQGASPSEAARRGKQAGSFSNMRGVLTNGLTRSALTSPSASTPPPASSATAPICCTAPRRCAIPYSWTGKTTEAIRRAS